MKINGRKKKNDKNVRRFNNVERKEDESFKRKKKLSIELDVNKINKGEKMKDDEMKLRRENEYIEDIKEKE